jgi:hypothetical protein
LSIRGGGVILAAEAAPDMNPRTLAYMSLFLVTATTPACRKETPAAHGEDPAESEKEAFGRLTIEELEAKMAAAQAGQAKLAVFDNNQHERFVQSHIAGAKWVAFDKITAADLPADRDTTLVFYCSNEH